MRAGIPHTTGRLAHTRGVSGGGKLARYFHRMRACLGVFRFYLFRGMVAAAHTACRANCPVTGPIAICPRTPSGQPAGACVVETERHVGSNDMHWQLCYQHFTFYRSSWPRNCLVLDSIAYPADLFVPKGSRE
ncbi:hypothetical protein HBH56_061130 [Parastagonospora nodorum]|nr:hypothetical protein HBH56_061130 [Parastagonospora nodorum]KAH3930956.1 hypothetical protein HBH54_105060 [Parastagonospora nodorum]KAH3968177.1 hypothetical protein HBH51_133720 [Parastagonospora nodorum]KAH4074087.1 hypothetical protein HBH50_042420 [Parastagonospora nodorum]KAH4091601.1 hypothetical protein HBH48_094740 [Parastagonospora nodorum]